MVYTVYKITNELNQKYYVGVHKTDDPNDSYFGSGIAIRNAIKKYGKESFRKDILLITESKEEAYQYEKDLTSNYSDANIYNMKQGGVGGFDAEISKRGHAAMIEKVSPSEAGKICYSKKAGMFARSKEDFLASSSKGGKANKGKPKSEEQKQKTRDTWKRKNASVA